MVGVVVGVVVTLAMNAAAKASGVLAFGTPNALAVVILTLPPLAVVVMMVVVMMFPLTSRRGRRTRRLDVLTDDSIICHPRLAVN